MGPYLVSFQWKANGAGLFCASWGTSDAVQKVKYANGEIQIQDGTKLEIKGYTNSTMIVHAPYFTGQDTQLYKDNQLENASIYCAEKLKTRAIGIGGI